MIFRTRPAPAAQKRRILVWKRAYIHSAAVMRYIISTPKVEAGADGAQDAVDEENNGKEPDENDLHKDLRFFDRLIVTAKAVESNLKYRARL